MSGICQRECENKTDLGYCKTTWCIKPLHLNETLATNLQQTCNQVATRKRKFEWLEKHVVYSRDIPKEMIIDTWQEAKCSNCGKWLTTPYTYYFNYYKYCPHCGMRMKEK